VRAFGAKTKSLSRDKRIVRLQGHGEHFRHMARARRTAIVRALTTGALFYRFRVKSAKRRGVVAYHMPCVQALLAAFIQVDNVVHFTFLSFIN
jgi:hypothetical protein